MRLFSFTRYRTRLSGTLSILGQLVDAHLRVMKLGLDDHKACELVPLHHAVTVDVDLQSIVRMHETKMEQWIIILDRISAILLNNSALWLLHFTTSVHGQMNPCEGYTRACVMLLYDAHFYFSIRNRL